MRMYAFYITLALFVMNALASYAQGNYDRGFKAGFKEGYCYNTPGCVAPISPVTPVPYIGEDYDSYRDGYNRGFKMGLENKKGNITNSRNSPYSGFRTSNSKATNRRGRSTDDDLLLRLVELRLQQIANEEEAEQRRANLSDYTDNYSGVARQKLKISSEGFFRDSPNSSGNVIFIIYQGSEIIGIRKSGDYWEAIYNNRRGYINDIYVDKISSSSRNSENQTYAYVDSEAFIRSEPNANSSTTVTVPGNSKVLIKYKSQNGYWNVQYGYHVGFMNEVYIRFSE